MTANLSRRKFLSRAAAAIAAPYIIPSSALGLDGAVAPSERIVVGCVGIRGRGLHDLRWMIGNPDVQVVAICDLQKAQREGVKGFIDQHYGNTDCAMYSDLREFLPSRPDIDAVLIATGDRWHAQAAVRAMREGKDVFSEKPSCMTITEGRAVVETAQRFGRVYQTGTQRLSEANHVFAIEMARTGRLGKVDVAYAHIAPWDAAKMPREWKEAQPEPPREEVDWDIWLGPCPWRPYNEEYARGGWRGDYDFHTSCIGEWGAHTFAQAQAGLGLGESSPIKYNYVDNDSADGMVCEFVTGQKLIFSRGDKYWYGSCGERFDGERGWAAAADGYSEPDVSSPELLRQFDEVVGEYVARTGRALDHMRNFLDCVKSREEPVANARVMHHSMCTVHAANICMWLERDLEFDPVTETFVNDDEANRLRSRAYREPWVI
ncbi:MAG TPA: Gfo/Idh/MocA family oxidoreductase [Candidatus Hydrogenedentes bacterium]|jgi:predicted dehydrogenase|nr:Gfo/Idh/MocA family oxidoreductase [Candidatus Hydrogenedentota bacterium]MDY0031158.1 Gfo/Idh/MocA family oxidoreductase [FCB group bacterium]HNV20693.1 Gfo/Idh/MocA family oxidoreductase [Candidatus Hydrogenedentota bacterium]HNZ19384.1 Gfo/Idh/MocA family oxidoreductase [Candidatus Hydrogenedentota bacterium]HOH34784.1 Gfo/Idh/MocA family oxidoreductase [Candidatus Hydrogenedentota bacterium]